MDYISGLTLKNSEFRPHLCKKIYEIDQNLKKHLLNHNDLHSNNIMITEKEDIVLLDYGESILSGM
jgi:RIO-like serine/threonine protein kinase